ncbi:MAG TPA: transglutaminase-like domain-containing protein [Baekduia sp.]|uniref:transglutaminase-like domain-containing protein n=1 Tax=Baekduia sp. TaxID=2600305 RepID=UPI002CDFF168|nr:transglutaminase-like domain-containing protein [Baekduia sp.]HMJ36623.1 transglutaminase-like domain-containing protein [Baekduia sp.]
MSAAAAGAAQAPPGPGSGARAVAAAGSEAWSIRLAALSALGLYGGVHWAGIVRPGGSGDLLGMFLVAVVTALLLPPALEVRGRMRRAGAVLALVIAALWAILAVAGVPLAALRPDRWDTLVVGIGDAIATLPALRVPYRGQDVLVRAVLLSGGGLLLAVGACLALLPRPRMFGAAVALGVLYAVPVVEHAPTHPYLDGSVFALLLGALLWADRLGQREAPVAIGLAVVAVLAAAIVAPAVDSNRPWVDYEALAESLQAGKTTTFTWNHDYAPLTWPRDGVELARVRSRGDLYLKTADLEVFRDGAWKQTREVLGGDDDTEFAGGHPDWTQTIHVSIKGLRSEQFLGAGTTMLVTHSTKLVREATPGTFEAATKPLRRGDSYDALVYVPRPGTVELHRAGTEYPSYVLRQLTVDTPGGAANAAVGPVEVRFPPWGAGMAPSARGRGGFMFVNPDQALASAGLGRSYQLAQQLRGGSTDPYDFVTKVIARVQRGARYTESPPPPGKLTALDAFLFRDHAGYCQHFAGATALLLRMGGVPARVVAGFAPGSRDGKDHVIRDLDAHSWVEAYFPRYGWVTFDPTPGDSPARSQQTDTRSQPSTAPSAARTTPSTGDRTSDPAAGGASAATGGGGTDLTLPLTGVGVIAGLAGAGALMAARRRRRLERSGDPELEELRIALVRSGRAPEPDMTLARLERLLAGNDGALGYLRALRLARYGAGSPAPTAEQRRALRRELGAGLGLRGRLRSLWALPPRPRELLAALKPRRRRSYTA